MYDTEGLRRGFNPRVRGTCLVSKGNLARIATRKVASFNPRVRGTCLVSNPVPKLWNAVKVGLYSFNPRVRGTCLVSC